MRDGHTPSYLITGATGFLGRHVLLALRRIVPDARLLVLVRNSQAWQSQEWRHEAGAVEVITGALFPTDSWRGDPRLAGLEGIFHLAAQVKHSRSDIDDMVRTNVEGTVSMVELAAALKARLLFVSTSGAVSCAKLPGQGAWEDGAYCEDVAGKWPYYASKMRAEREARRRAQELGVELVVMRPPVLLGPGDHRYRSTSNVLRVLRGRLPFILAGGMHFVDVRDAADAMVRAMLVHQPQPVYHLTGSATTLDEFFRTVARHAAVKPSWLTLPGGLLRAAARLNEMTGGHLHILPDPVVVEMAGHYWDLRSRHAEADLGYRSRAADETVADTVAWLRANHPDLNDASKRTP